MASDGLLCSADGRGRAYGPAASDSGSLEVDACPPETTAVQPAVRSEAASQPSRCDIARAHVVIARTWPVVSAARHRIDQG